MTNTIKQLKPQSKNLVPDAIAGFTNAVVNTPDAIGAAVLAGVNPTYAFNAVMVGAPVGAIFTSSEFMSIGPTSAMMITVGTVLAGYSGETALTAMVTLTVLVGIFMLAMGLLKLGSITRFISNAVMVGFLTGLAVLIILGQLGDFTGFESNQATTAVGVAISVTTILAAAYAGVAMASYSLVEGSDALKVLAVNVFFLIVAQFLMLVILRKWRIRRQMVF